MCYRAFLHLHGDLFNIQEQTDAAEWLTLLLSHNRLNFRHEAFTKYKLAFSCICRSSNSGNLNLKDDFFLLF